MSKALARNIHHLDAPLKVVDRAEKTYGLKHQMSTTVLSKKLPNLYDRNIVIKTEPGSPSNYIKTEEDSPS